MIGDENGTKRFSVERLRGYTVEQRHTLWKNARSKDSAEAKEIVRLIEECGLPYSEVGGLAMDDPITLKICEIVNSDVGKAACLDAARSGLPAIAGVDAMLNEALGVNYGKHNMSTNTAGSLIADLMRRQGFKNVGQTALPPGYVARSGVLWAR